MRISVNRRNNGIPLKINYRLISNEGRVPPLVLPIRGEALNGEGALQWTPVNTNPDNLYVML